MYDTLVELVATWLAAILWSVMIFAIGGSITLIIAVFIAVFWLIKQSVSRAPK